MEEDVEDISALVPNPAGCWFRGIEPAMSRTLIEEALRPAERRRGHLVGRHLSMFARHAGLLPGIRAVAQAQGVRMRPPTGLAVREHEPYREWLQRLFAFHGIEFGHARYYKYSRYQDDEDIVALKHVKLKSPRDTYRQFLYDCELRAGVLGELQYPQPRSDKDRRAMLRQIAAEINARELCPCRMKPEELKAELFFV